MNKADRDFRKKKILELYFKEHLSTVEISDIFNMSYGQVSKIIRSFTNPDIKKRLYHRGKPVGYGTKRKCPVCRRFFNSYINKYCSKKCGGIGRRLSPEEKRIKNNIRCKQYYQKHKNDVYFKEQIKKHNRTQYPKLVTSGYMKKLAEKRKIKMLDLKLNDPLQYQECVNKNREKSRNYYFLHRVQILKRQKEQRLNKKLLTV